MPETLQSHNISIYNNMREWVKNQVAMTYAETQWDLQKIKVDIETNSLEKKLTMIEILNVLKSGKTKMKDQKTVLGVFNQMWGWLVLAIQIALKKLWHNPGSIDWIYKNKRSVNKSKTQLAVESFQSANGLVVDGIAWPLTLDKLALAFESSLWNKPVVVTSKLEKGKVAEVEKKIEEVVDEKIEKKEVEEKIVVAVKKELEKHEEEINEEEKKIENDEKLVEDDVKLVEEKIVNNQEQVFVTEDIENSNDPMENISSFLTKNLSSQDAERYKNILKQKVDEGKLTIKDIEHQLENVIEEALDKDLSKEQITWKILFRIYLMIEVSPESVRNEAVSLLNDLGQIRSKYYNKKEKKQYPTTDPKDIENAAQLTQKMNTLFSVYQELNSKEIS